VIEQLKRNEAIALGTLRPTCPTKSRLSSRTSSTVLMVSSLALRILLTTGKVNQRSYCWTSTPKACPPM
jgi:hypothetical protein